jgi:hypothetical protein
MAISGDRCCPGDVRHAHHAKDSGGRLHNDAIDQRGPDVDGPEAASRDRTWQLATGIRAMCARTLAV